jgi:hypothetical protein
MKHESFVHFFLSCLILLACQRECSYLCPKLELFYLQARFWQIVSSLPGMICKPSETKALNQSCFQIHFCQYYPDNLEKYLNNVWNVGIFLMKPSIISSCETVEILTVKKYFTSSYPHHDMYTFCYWQIFWHSI